MDLNQPFSFSNDGGGRGEHNQLGLPFFGKGNMKSATHLLLSVSVCTEENKVKIHTIASKASEELQQMVLEKEPLWLMDKEAKTEVLSNAAYNRRFAGLDATLEEVVRVITTGGPLELAGKAASIGVGSFRGLSVEDDLSLMENESSRAVGFVSVDPLSLVNMIMDVENWSTAFSNIVSKASNLGVLSTGEPGNPHGVLQVVAVELHFPSPLVRTREICFARYSKQLDSNSWLVTDVSLEDIFPNLASRYRRRPSGCLIEALNKGSSKVTWVENNVAVNDVSLLSMFKPISAHSFGAKRWIATLEREYDRKYIFREQFQQTPKMKKNGGKKSLLQLAERMLRRFNANVSSHSENSWRTLPIMGAEDILYKINCNLDHPGIPFGLSITISTSVQLQKPHKDIFKFLCNVHDRNKWDILSGGGVIQVVEQISFGPDPANRVALLLSTSMNNSRAKEKPEIMYVQETLNDSMGLYVVYAPVEKVAIHHIMEGKDPDIVAILPSGFVVSSDSDTSGGGGSILTIAFEIMDGYISSPEQQLPPQSAATAESIVRTTVDMIKSGLT